jgi:hypothetical protein
MTVVELLKQDSEEVLAKWQFLWKPSPLTKEKPAEQPEAKKAEAPAPAETKP